MTWLAQSQSLVDLGYPLEFEVNVGIEGGAVPCPAQQEVGSSLRKRFAVRRIPSDMVR